MSAGNPRAAETDRKENGYEQLVEIAALAAAIIYVVVSQVRGQQLEGRRLIVVPAVLILIGMAGLAGMHGVGPDDVACITVSALIAAVIGLGQGAMTHLEAREESLWGRLPARGLWLWAALIVSRVAVVSVAHFIGADAATSMDAILLALGINRLAQAGTIAARAFRAGLPLAQ